MSAKPRILYISSASLVSGPGAIGWRHVTMMKDSGYDVDVLTLYREKLLPEVMYVKKSRKLNEFFMRLKRLWSGDHLPGSPHYFFYRNEKKPPIPIEKITSKINKNYNLVIIYFWQWMLSYATVEAIYDMLERPVFFFLSPDYSHMSGGCHFTCDCLKYQIGCGSCPAINSDDENDFTHQNVLYRKRVLDKIKPIVFGNSYMYSFYQKSFLLKNARIIINPPFFDVRRYKQVDKALAKEKLGISQSKSFIIALGCQQLSEPRKGIDYLIEALHIFKSRLSDEEAMKVLLLVAGKEYTVIESKLPFPSIGVGLLPIEMLSEFYSSADVFICSSIDEAGPSMVSQSISCGTPVVGFKMGAMLDCVEDKGTGYCAELKDCNDLAFGIEKFFRMSIEERDEIRSHCREFAINNSNSESRIKRWIELYEKYK